MNQRPFWLLLIAAELLSGCATTKMGFNKSRILDATMDPSKTGVAVSRLQDQPASLWERANTSSGASVGGSCPTCGT